MLVGKHGDHIGGERDAVRALVSGEADAACILDANHLAFTREGTIPSGTVRILAQTPPYDHCNFTVLDGAHAEPVARFRELLLGMSYADAGVRPLLDMEGLKQWVPGRVSGYAQLSAAIERFRTIEPFVNDLRGSMRLDLESLPFAEGGYLLVKRAMRAVGAGEAVTVHGTAPDWMWIFAAGRVSEGHRFEWRPGDAGAGGHAVIVNGRRAWRPMDGRRARWRRGRRCSVPTTLLVDGAWPPAGRCSKRARSTSIFVWSTRSRSGRTMPRRIYAQAAAAQWDPETAVPWNADVQPSRRHRGRGRSNHDLSD